METSRDPTDGGELHGGVYRVCRVSSLHNKDVHRILIMPGVYFDKLGQKTKRKPLVDVPLHRDSQANGFPLSDAFGACAALRSYPPSNVLP